MTQELQIQTAKVLAELVDKYISERSNGKNSQ